MAVKVFKAGAPGCIAKESASETLIKGIHAVSRGEYFLDRGLTSRFRGVS